MSFHRPPVFEYILQLQCLAGLWMPACEVWLLCIQPSFFHLVKGREKEAAAT